MRQQQHASPCKQCPFRRKGLPGYLGGSTPEVFIGQAHGEFWLPCHMHSNYEDPNWGSDISKPQCAGAAIYRANVYKRTKNPKLLQLNSDRGLVFSEPAEFIAYHKRISIKKAKAELNTPPTSKKKQAESLCPSNHHLCNLKTRKAPSPSHSGSAR